MLGIAKIPMIANYLFIDIAFGSLRINRMSTITFDSFQNLRMNLVREQ